MLRCLEVLVKGQAVTSGGLGLLLLGILLGACHDTCLLVVTDTLLEEVGLTSQRDGLHEVEGVSGVEVLLVTKSDKKAVSNKLNVLTHEVGVHSQERAGKSIREELLLDRNRLNDDVLDDLVGWTPVQVREEQAGKVGVETLVTRDELVRERETGHQATLLQPKDRGKRAGEEDTLNGSKCNQTLGECRFLILDPLNSPVGLLANARNFYMSAQSTSRAYLGTH